MRKQGISPASRIASRILAKRRSNQLPEGKKELELALLESLLRPNRCAIIRLRRLPARSQGQSSLPLRLDWCQQRLNNRPKPPVEN